MRVEIITHENGDQIPIMLDDDGLPVVRINEFILSRRHLSTNTLTRNLRELTGLQQWLNINGVDLNKRLLSPTAFTEAELKGGLVEALRSSRHPSSSKQQAVSPNTFNLRLTTVGQFLTWYAHVAAGQQPVASNAYELIRENISRIIRYLDGAYMNVPAQHSGAGKGLNERQTKFLLSVLDPQSSNPVGHDTAVLYRNYISVSVMLLMGLRPGELLCLRVGDIQFGAISSLTVVRRPPDPYDMRRPRPQIKRNGRILPINNHALARNLDEYIMNWRSILENRSTVETDYLILSDEGKPLSQASITQFFRILRHKYASELPVTLTAKTLRHTFSSRLEKDLRETGIDEQRRREILAYVRGDSSLNSQNIYIAQEIEEQAKKALASFHKKLLQ